MRSRSGLLKAPKRRSVLTVSRFSTSPTSPPSPSAHARPHSSPPRLGGQDSWQLARNAASREAPAIRPAYHQELAGGLPLSVLQDEPVQAVLPSQRPQGRLRRLTVAARRLACPKRFRSYCLAA